MIATDSAISSFKKAIQEHELTFRNQVRELHRLYWTQKNLMKELLQNGISSSSEMLGNDLCGKNSNNNNDYLEFDLAKANEIIDIEDSMDSERQEKATEACSDEFHAPIEKISGLFGSKPVVICHGRLKDQTANDSCIGMDYSCWDSGNDRQSRKTYESRATLIDLNLPDLDSHPEDKNTKNFIDFENRPDINARPFSHEIPSMEGTTGSCNEAFSRNETPFSSIETSKDEDEDRSEHQYAANTDNSSDLPQSAIRISTEKSNDKETSYSYEEDDRELNTDDSVITHSHSSENEQSYFEKSRPEEQDAETESAAQALLAISFGIPAISAAEKFDDRNGTLRSSSDSFENRALNSPEIKNDEICEDLYSLNCRLRENASNAEGDFFCSC